MTLIGENIKYEDNFGNLDDQILDVLNIYLGNPVDAFYIFNISYADENVPIRSFYKDNIGKDSDILLNNKLKIINYLLYIFI